MKSARRLLFFLMLIVFVAQSLTGIIKFPELQRFFSFIFAYIPASTVTYFHDWTGIVLIILIIIHLVLNRQRFFGEWQKKGRLLLKNKSIIISMAALLIVLAIFFIGLFGKNQPLKLSSVEVSNYKGEKLGSINDFRENSIKGPQNVDKNSYGLKITGLVNKEISYKYNDVLKFQKYQKVVQLNCVEGWSVKVLWEGILVKDLLKGSLIKPQAKTIIFYAADGYSTSFPLDYIMNNDIMMAYKMNNVILPPERGFPFQLVAEQKWGYKWIKWITKIELSDNTNYQGYWEQRGYNNNGDLNGSKFQ